MGRDTDKCPPMRKGEMPMDEGPIDMKGVSILDPKFLLQCAQDPSPEARTALAKAVSTFFDEHTLNETQQKLASGILMNLIRQAEIDLKQALAERLASAENIPQELIVYLANDDISVARHVLLASPVLNDIDLMYVITSKGEEHWQTIAGRPNLSPMVTDRLIDTGDTRTMINLVANTQVTLQKGSMKKLAKAALGSEELQMPLLRRPEVDAELATDLYLVVSEALRREVSTRFKLQEHAVAQSLETLVHELSHEARGITRFTPQMEALAKRIKERKEINPDLMIRTLRRGQVGFFISLFAEQVGMSPDNIVKLIQKDAGRPFVIACRSMGMMKSEFASIFLLSRGIRTGDKIVDQRELAMALKYYDSVKEFDVQRIMASWLKNPDLI